MKQLKEGIIMEKLFYENLVESANHNYNYIIGNKQYTFVEGKEKDFTIFLESWTEVFNRACSNGRTLGSMSNYQDSLLKIFVNSLTNLNWEEVWLNINEHIYNNDNKFIFEYLMKSISFDSFIKKINECNDLRLVYQFYILYGKINKLSPDETKQKYITYLDNTITRIGSTYEIMLDYYFDQSVIDNNSDLEDLICILLEKADLDYVVEDKLNNNDKIIHSLKDKIAVNLAIFHGSDKIINKFLSLNPSMYFKNGYGNTTDICQLNFRVGNNEEGKRIFNSDEYQLYSLQQYNALKNNKYYDVNDYDQPVDYLAGILRSAEKSILLELLYSDKVKMVGAEYLHVIKNILGDEEYEKFMEHVDKNNILIYFIYEHEKVMVSDNLNTTLSYLRMKNNDKTLMIIRS